MAESSSFRLHAEFIMLAALPSAAGLFSGLDLGGLSQKIQPVCLAVAVLCLVWILYRWHGRRKIARLNLQLTERISERERIAQDLHDTLLQELLSASMQLQIADDELPADSPAKPFLQHARSLISRAIEGARDSIGELRARSKYATDLEGVFLQIQRELLMGQTLTTPTIRLIVLGASRPLRSATLDEVYLIGREAVLNAVLHARASEIEIELEFAIKSLRIGVRDDGCGINAQELRSGRKGHWGLTGMKERAERIGGELKVRSSTGVGTEIELVVPGQVAFKSRSNRAARWFSRGLPQEERKRNILIWKGACSRP